MPKQTQVAATCSAFTNPANINLIEANLSKPPYYVTVLMAIVYVCTCICMYVHVYVCMYNVYTVVILYYIQIQNFKKPSNSVNAN